MHLLGTRCMQWLVPCQGDRAVQVEEAAPVHPNATACPARPGLPARLLLQRLQHAAASQAALASEWATVKQGRPRGHPPTCRSSMAALSGTQRPSSGELSLPRPASACAASSASLSSA